MRDFIEEYRIESQKFADVFIEEVNADDNDVIRMSRDAGCRIRDHIENLRRKLAAAPALPAVEQRGETLRWTCVWCGEVSYTSDAHANHRETVHAGWREDGYSWPAAPPDDKDAIIGQPTLVQEIEIHRKELIFENEALKSTIRQMTELLREYRGWMKNVDGCDIYYGVVPNGSDQRCRTCIKTDLLLKENK